VRQIAEAGATHVSPIVLHLRPGAREWFLAWLGEHHPDLVPRYRGLYGSRAYAPQDYQQRIAEQVRGLAERYHVGRGSPPPNHRTWRRAAQPAPLAEPASEQLARARL
jgi:DNA repair photolyase